MFQGLAETKTSIGNLEVRKASVNLVLVSADMIVLKHRSCHFE